ncbi:hypothetical protein B0H11DRAFT_1937501 [Mycena galericulata]|nr:hypothetical protein B0H11DRAFT_1937501 [Mycena galericulata]
MRDTRNQPSVGDECLWGIPSLTALRLSCTKINPSIRTAFHQSFKGDIGPWYFPARLEVYSLKKKCCPSSAHARGRIRTSTSLWYALPTVTNQGDTQVVHTGLKHGIESLVSWDVWNCLCCRDMRVESDLRTYPCVSFHMCTFGWVLLPPKFLTFTPSTPAGGLEPPNPCRTKLYPPLIWGEGDVPLVDTGSYRLWPAGFQEENGIPGSGCRGDSLPGKLRARSFLRASKHSLNDEKHKFINAMAHVADSVIPVNLLNLLRCLIEILHVGQGQQMILGVYCNVLGILCGSEAKFAQILDPRYVGSRVRTESGCQTVSKVRTIQFG